uniref:Uncharacterized protein n=1 Tax=Octopus bimaculoides TaxID=37653 RepID=A0A0L8HJG2_OCTBM
MLYVYIYIHTLTHIFVTSQSTFGAVLNLLLTIEETAACFSPSSLTHLYAVNLGSC